MHQVGSPPNKCFLNVRQRRDARGHRRRKDGTDAPAPEPRPPTAFGSSSLLAARAVCPDRWPHGLLLLRRRRRFGPCQSAALSLVRFGRRIMLLVCSLRLRAPHGFSGQRTGQARPPGVRRSFSGAASSSSPAGLLEDDVDGDHRSPDRTVTPAPSPVVGSRRLGMALARRRRCAHLSALLCLPCHDALLLL